ncbi:MAG: hypothetical protein ACE5D2_06235 [Fidelibacterota bacterium]
MDNTNVIIWSMLFGAVGVGYIVYGRKQKRAIAFLAGVGMVVLPYFIASVFILILTGLVLMAIPFFLKF